MELLNSALSDRDANVRKSAVEAILQGREKQVVRLMTDARYEGIDVFQDPKIPITKKVVREFAKKTGTTEAEIRRRYEALSNELGLRLKWRKSR